LRKARFVNETTKIIRGIISLGKYRQTEQQKVARCVRVAKSEVCQCKQKNIRGIISLGKYRQTEQQQVARNVRVAKSEVCQ
jgi:hypothetical protein